MSNNFLLVSTPRYDPQLRAACEAKLEHSGWNYSHESPIYLLNLHRDRLLKAAEYWGWRQAVQVLEGSPGIEILSKGLNEFIDSSQQSPLRLRILVGPDGSLKFEKYDIAACSLSQLFPRRLPPPDDVASDSRDPAKSPEYVLLVDSESTERSAHTYFKTTHRPMYDAARKRARLAPTDLKEILLIDSKGFVMEGSITTPYFWRGGQWVTPPVPTEPSKAPSAGSSGGQDGVSRRWALQSEIATEGAVDVASLVNGEGCWLSNGARGFIFARLQL